METATVICRVCEQPFESEVCQETLAAFGRALCASICDVCASATKAAPDPEVERQRRGSRWIQTVGSYYEVYDSAKLPEEIKPHTEQILKWQPMKGHPGIGLIGPTHTAKSKVIHELGRRLYMDGYDVFPTSGMEFQTMVLKQVSNRDAWDGYLERCEKAHVLLLDDADKLKLTDAVEAWYYGMLEARRKWLRPVLATVNVAGDQMTGSENRLPAIVSRLRDLCEWRTVP
jgi:hypothetical protein